MRHYRNHVALEDILATGEALVKFRREHGYIEQGLLAVIACNDALRQNDFATALKHFRGIAFGGMNCFGDWIPSVAFDHEDGNYVSVVDVALTERWYRQMTTAAGRAG